jgi:peptidoglycan hydrolase CwlO-like protein
MLKKLVIAGVLVGTVGSLVAFGGRPFSYARTWVVSWKKNAEDRVPLDLKIKHAREEVDKLGPEIRKCMRVVAEQQVDIEQMDARVARHQKELKEQELAILKLRNDLKSGEPSYVYAGQSYMASEVRKDLAVRFDRFREAEESLGRERKILAAKRKSLRANERRLDEMMAAKKQLVVQIEQLEARWKTVQAAQEASEIEFDDSQLSRTKTLIAQINKELEVRTKLLAADGKMDTGTIPVNTKPADIPVVDVTKGVDEYFAKRNGSNGRITVAATKPASK